MAAADRYSADSDLARDLADKHDIAMQARKYGERFYALDDSNLANGT